MEIFQETIAARQAAYEAAAHDKKVPLCTHPKFLSSVQKIWIGSPFVALQAERFPELIYELFQGKDILNPYQESVYRDRLAKLLSAKLDEDELFVRLRAFRRREMIRIIWRDLAGWSRVSKMMNELSALADACIEHASNCLYQWQCQEYGFPETYRGQPQNLIVLALGKLGGRELNLSSDVDLIFSYPSTGMTQHKERSISHEQFFNRLGQRLIKVLNQVTADGFVFRVDMRLRPLGSSGPLVPHFTAMRKYYETQGRDWERYALVKTRLVSGDLRAGKQLIRTINNFVYRRYLDFSAIEALRKMHEMIVSESSSKRLQDNVKLGYGGIREIEFLVQVYQLIRGGEEPWLQHNQLLPVLQLEAKMGLVTKKVARRLMEAYNFLRNTEHRLQAVDDRQTHDLPSDDYARARLAYTMGFAHWEAFYKKLSELRNQVHTAFQGVVARPKFAEVQDTSEQRQHDIENIWLEKQAGEDALSILKEMGFKEPEKAQEFLTSLRNSQDYQVMTSLGRKRLDNLMPILLITVGKKKQAGELLRRVLIVIESLLKRTTYMVLLLENPKAIKQLLKLCGASPWVADQLARYPFLLGELLDVRRLYASLDSVSLAHDLEHRLSVLKGKSHKREERLAILSRFKLVEVLRVAAMDVTGTLPIMRVSDHLTDIAVVILTQVRALAWRSLREKHGAPSRSVERSHFMIIAYGKLGGIELGYGSDLDLVFVYDDAAFPQEETEFMTRGPEPINYRVFYTRLGQLIIHYLESRIAGSTLYEVDTRLRPSGEAGLLVASLSRFRAYQREDAWTWEHQALVRARAVCGNQSMVKRFNDIRAHVLGQVRDDEKLRNDVIGMREKMRDAAGAVPEGYFDLKQGIGGITDIEFIAQYGVLRWAHKYPMLYEYTDNIRILESLGACQLLTIDEIKVLSDAYRAYRAMAHRLDLQSQPGHVSDKQFQDYRREVGSIWRRLLLHSTS